MRVVALLILGIPFLGHTQGARFSVEPFTRIGCNVEKLSFDLSSVNPDDDPVIINHSTYKKSYPVYGAGLTLHALSNRFDIGLSYSFTQPLRGGEWDARHSVRALLGYQLSKGKLTVTPRLFSGFEFQYDFYTNPIQIGGGALLSLQLSDKVQVTMNNDIDRVAQKSKNEEQDQIPTKVVGWRFYTGFGVNISMGKP